MKTLKFLFTIAVVACMSTGCRHDHVHHHEKNTGKEKSGQELAHQHREKK